MTNIDYILELFDWNNLESDHFKGVELSKDVKCINVFLQPGNPYGKRVWDNCAKALCQRDDEELSPYLVEMLEWLQDMNWPGAFCIANRLCEYSDISSLNLAIEICCAKARLLHDEVWEMNMNMLDKKN